MHPVFNLSLLTVNSAQHALCGDKDAVFSAN